MFSSVFLLKQLFKNLYFFYKILKRGQSKEYEALQVCHRIEKGLLIENPRPRWGWEKINYLQSMADDISDYFVRKLTKGIIREYAINKDKSLDPYDRDNASTLDRSSDFKVAGKLHLSIDDVKNDLEAGRKLFLSRHSIREFDKRKVSKKYIMSAVELANRCPSACNRQMSKVYVLDGELRHQFFEDDVDDVFPPQFIIITADINAFIMEEFYDWFVSSSIFAGYLSLAFHLYGIGSCCLRKPLYFELESMKRYREHFQIPENEQIVLEMAIGYYKKSFEVACSARKPIDDLVVFDNN